MVCQGFSIALLDGGSEVFLQAFARKKPQIVKETAVLKPANGATYTPTIPAAALPSSPNPRAKATVSAEEAPQVCFCSCIGQDGQSPTPVEARHQMAKLGWMCICCSHPSKLSSGEAHDSAPDIPVSIPTSSPLTGNSIFALPAIFEQDRGSALSRKLAEYDCCTTTSIAWSGKVLLLAWGHESWVACHCFSSVAQGYGWGGTGLLDSQGLFSPTISKALYLWGLLWSNGIKVLSVT